jgi:N-acetylmuramoyl-L-alanine amidase
MQHELDQEYALLRILGAEAQLRLYRSRNDGSQNERTRNDQAYLTSAKALLEPIGRSLNISASTRSQALVLAGDIAVYAGTLDAAERSFLRAQEIDPDNALRATERLQGLRNGTFRKLLPATDREVPRIIRKRSDLVSAQAAPVVVLDPGHGGSDLGASSAFGGVEKEITLDIARRVKTLLERRYRLKVQLTREDDTFVPLARRTAFANGKSATVFVSLHVNASEKHDAEGLEAYYLDNTDDEASRKLAERENGVAPGEALDDLSFMLSDLIQSGKLEDSILLTRSIESGLRSKVLTLDRNLRSLGVKKAPFFVLVGAHAPCALIEMFFVDNPTEGAKLRQDSFRSALATGIAQGIAGFLRRS